MSKGINLFAWLTMGALLTAAGCAESYQRSYYREPYPAAQRYYLGDVPPSFYNHDPTLRHWYTAPYWHPETP